ncbi:hypothetical protein ACN469_14220 [Corallococcus terminator]
MQAKHLLGGVLLMGLLSGCGGAIPEEGADSAALESREDALPACQRQSYELIFFREPEMINEIGWWHCYCGQSSAWVSGGTSSYSAYTYKNACR